MAFGGRLLDQLRHIRLVGEALRFMVVGGLATSVAFVLFNLLVHGLFFGHGAMASHPIAAYVVANTIGMLISYELSRRWTFAHRVSVHPDGGFTAYVIINIITMALPIGCLYVSRNLLGLADPVSDNISANVIGVLLGQVGRFFLFRRFVFGRPIRYTEVYGAVPESEPELDADGVDELDQQILSCSTPTASGPASATDSARRDQAR